MGMRIIGSVIMTSLSVVLIVYFNLAAMIQDIPDAIAKRPATLSAQVTDSYWRWNKDGIQNWHFQLSGQTFRAGRQILKAGEYATVTYLPHSHFIIEYKHEKAE